MTSNATVSPASKLIRSRRAATASPGVAALAVPANVELWMLLLTQFDPTQAQFSTAEIARIIGVNADAVSFHCRRLWPREHGEPREVRSINFADLVWLLRHYAREGRKLPDARVLYSKLRAGGRISPLFPRDCAAVCQGQRIVASRRRALLSR